MPRIRATVCRSQERFNGLQFFSTEDRRGRQGFRRIEVAPDHQLGFNDLEAIEGAGFLDAVACRRPEPFNFGAGLRIQTPVETIRASTARAPGETFVRVLALARICPYFGGLGRAQIIPSHCSVTVGMRGFAEFP